MLYRISNGSVTLGNKTILEDINFEVKNNEHVAIVGRNGCGKTTLLKAIIGDVLLDSGLMEGDVSVNSLGVDKIGYVRQDAIEKKDVTLLDEILKAYSDILLVSSSILFISSFIFLIVSSLDNSNILE